MIGLFHSRIRAGIDISGSKVVMARIDGSASAASSERFSDIRLEENTVKPSFRQENILNEASFCGRVRQVSKGANIRSVGVSLPDACFKVLIKHFNEVPDKQGDLEKLVEWSVSDSVSIPTDALKVSWLNMGQAEGGYHVFLIVLAMKTVVNQYERMLKKCGLKPVIIVPAGLSQFNHFALGIPEIGNIAYLGIFEDGLTTLVFSDALPVFYKVVKKGLISVKEANIAEDMDMLLKYFRTEYTDFKIDHFYIASHIQSEERIRHMVEDILPVEMTMIKDSTLGTGSTLGKAEHGISERMLYASALGAARALEGGHR
ncbi:MAG: hypothetical protein D3926_07090 [Desulfobacteraceae bacterium]|nr:MAG: hypothetical protein D3926_07090 [Desulfobacteraceae bacterium]